MFDYDGQRLGAGKITFFEYPITRRIPLSRGTLTLIIIGGLAFVGIMTVINVVAVRYEYVTITSTDYDPTSKLWCEIFIA
jgi:hypothetical protein